MRARVAVLLDGGFVTRRLHAEQGSYPGVEEVVELTHGILGKNPVRDMDLLRLYFYDSDPFEGVSTNPIDGSGVNFNATERARSGRALLRGLELEPRFAVRRGTITMTGWKLGRGASRSLRARAGVGSDSFPRAMIEARDLVPDMRQKGVDLRIGLDIAWIALKRLAECIVLVTGDSEAASC